MPVFLSFSLVLLLLGQGYMKQGEIFQTNSDGNT